MSERPKGIGLIVFIGSILILIDGLFFILLLMIISIVPPSQQVYYRMWGVFLARIVYNVIALVLLYKMKKVGYWMTMAGATVVAIFSSKGLIEGIMRLGVAMEADSTNAISISLFFLILAGMALAYLFPKRQLFQ